MFLFLQNAPNGGAEGVTNQRWSGITAERRQHPEASGQSTDLNELRGICILVYGDHHLSESGSILSVIVGSTSSSLSTSGWKMGLSRGFPLDGVLLFALCYSSLIAQHKHWPVCGAFPGPVSVSRLCAIFVHETRHRKWLRSWILDDVQCHQARLTFGFFLY